MSDITQELDSRRIFIDTLCELAEVDDKIVLVVCDVGFNYIDKFKEKFPNRFYNLGTTEPSSMIIVAGMALQGMKPYIYSMINFVLFRPFEMVRNAVVHHKANVKIIGVKGSEKYKFLGFSHNLDYDNQDIELCRNLGLSYETPKIDEVKFCIEQTYDTEQPFYIRL